jgi:hypothetical protein
MSWFQSSVQCACGSWYRVDDKCNKCGAIISEPIEESKIFISRSNTGRRWSKAKHRYLTAEEIKRGERGG